MTMKTMNRKRMTRRRLSIQVSIPNAHICMLSIINCNQLTTIAYLLIRLITDREETGRIQLTSDYTASPSSSSHSGMCIRQIDCAFVFQRSSSIELQPVLDYCSWSCWRCWCSTLTRLQNYNYISLSICWSLSFVIVSAVASAQTNYYASFVSDHNMILFVYAFPLIVFTRIDHLISSVIIMFSISISHWLMNTVCIFNNSHTR